MQWTWPLRLPLLVLAAGAIYTLALQTQIREGVFYSCDGGLKFLLARQLAQQGVSGARFDLALHAPAWAEPLWRQGSYPFEEPFVYKRGGRHFIQYPVFFPAACAPLYAWFGWRGLYVLPLAATWMLWVVFLRACVRLELSAAFTAAALAGLIFAAPLTLYSAMFWEHAPALCLGMAGFLTAWLTPLPTAVRGVIAGAALGLAGWLRPEFELAAVCTAAVVVLGPRDAWTRRGRVGFAAAVAATSALLLAWNHWNSGSVLGFHGQQSLDDPLRHGEEGLRYFWIWTVSLVRFAPLVLVGFAACLFRSGSGWGPRGRRMLAPLAAVMVMLPFIFPNDGGKQWGPRYLFLVVPPLVLLAARWWGESRGALRLTLTAAWTVALALGGWLNTWRGAADLADDYAQRILPALRFLQAAPQRVVVANSHFVSMELTASFASKTWLLARDAREIAEVAAVLRRQGERRFLLLLMDRPGTPPTLHFNDGAHRVRVTFNLREAAGPVQALEAEIADGSL